MSPYASAGTDFATGASDSLWSRARETAALLGQAGCFLGRSIVRTGVVTRTGPDGGMPGAIHDYFDLPETAIERLDARRVGDGVLVANVLRHLQRDLVYLGNVLGIK